MGPHVLGQVVSMYLVANLQRTDDIAVSIHLQFVAQEQYLIVVCLVLNLDLFHIEITDSIAGSFI